MAAKDDQIINVLAGAFSYGHARAQVPHQVWIPNTGSEEDRAQAQLHADTMAQAIDRAITEGTLAWSVANPTRLTGKVIYTTEPRNPDTGRLLNTYAFMTPLALVRYGPELYERYVQAIATREKALGYELAALDEPQFRQSLLQTTVPVAPALAHLVPADILAQAAPPKPKKVKPTVGADGFISALGPRQAQSLLYGDLKGQALLDRLDKWKIGPSTSLPGARDPAAEIIRAVISHAGPAGVVWLTARQFTLPDDVYRLALSGNAGAPVLDALEQAGVDPHATTRDGNLWNFIADTRRWDPEVVEWARAREVSWHEKNAVGDVPLSLLFHAISHEAGLVDFFSPDRMGGGTLGPLAAFAASMVPTMRGEMKQHSDRVDFLENLALEMVRDGVDLEQENKQGLKVSAHIFPEQSSAQARLFALSDPKSPDRGGDVMRELMFGDRDKLRRDPGAYGQRARDFIRKVEQASGQSLLEPDGTQLRKSPRP